ncbi:MAG: YfhO family protein, partial [Raoultibacter sp.]
MKSVTSKLQALESRIRTREGSSEKQKTRTLWLTYTILFVVFAFLALFVYPSNGRSLVWSVDGLEQYYPFFVYEGQWLREVVGGLFSGQGLVLPAWEFSLGYGSDVFISIDAFLDPLNLLSGLCPEAFSEYLFQFLVVFRMYLAGAAFIAFARYQGLARYPVICGALLYALCGTAMCVLHWPGGIWPMILFPLLLLGVEKIFRNERPFLFVAIVAAFFIISYYFAYMACLLLLLYCSLRVFSVEKTMTVGRFLKWFGKLLGLSLIGIAIAGVVLVPGVIALLSIDRVASSEVTVPLLYSFDYYQHVFAGFIGHADVGSDCLIGFGGVALIACIVLFSQKKSHTVLKVLFIVLSLFLLIPFVGSVFNGFNYATNRWVWAYAFCVAYIVAVMVPLLLSLEKRQTRTVLIAVGIYTVILFVFPDMRTEANIAAIVVLLLAVMVIMQTGLLLVVKQAMLVGCIGLGVMGSTYYLASPEEGGWGYYSSPIASLYTK